MGSMRRDDAKLALIDVVVMLCQHKKNMLLCFVCSLLIFSALIWLKPMRHDFYSVFEVGARGIDGALERPDMLVERMQDIFVPSVVGVHKEKWLGHGETDLEVKVLYKVGSNLIKLYTPAPRAREADVRALHEGVLQRALVVHQKRFTHVKHALMVRKEALVAVVDAGKGVYSKLKLAEKKAELAGLEAQLANLSASSFGPVAVPSIKQAVLGRGELFGFALVLCILLSFIAGAMSIFIAAVRARLD